MKTDKKIIQFSCIVDSVNTKKDGTLTIKLGTQELTSEDMAILFSFAQQFIWVAAAKEPLSEKDIDVPDIIGFDNRKTSSERLRSVIFIYWRDYTNQKTEFNTFYSQYMEKIIEKVKEKLY